MEWTTAKLAGLILAIFVLIVIIFFIYSQIGSESSVVSNIDMLWNKHVG